VRRSKRSLHKLTAGDMAVVQPTWEVGERFCFDPMGLFQVRGPLARLPEKERQARRKHADLGPTPTSQLLAD
jgi:hypothetical protein